MEGKIIQRAESNVVAIGWTGPYENAREIPSVWKQFYSRVGDIQGRKEPDTFISPCHDRETDFTCYIGAEVDDFDAVPQGMVALKVPGHKYAVFTHSGPMEKVQETYMNIFSWLQQNGYEKDTGAFSLEVYDKRHNPATDDGTSERNAYDIYVPIK